ncbi:hypothetical protein NKI48_03185 [Mesorhizobium sp. M0644]|uniref:hypothetical protein n=1 Tax=Mesorhizobium sp. M0644 TaxID=2956979 RepID=UPI00333DE96E
MTISGDPICRKCATQEHGSPPLPENCICAIPAAEAPAATEQPVAHQWRKRDRVMKHEEVWSYVDYHTGLKIREHPNKYEVRALGVISDTSTPPAPTSAVDGLTYARISEIVHECRDRQRSAGEGDQMLSRWISEALSKAQAAPTSAMDFYPPAVGDPLPMPIKESIGAVDGEVETLVERLHGELLLRCSHSPGKDAVRHALIAALKAKAVPAKKEGK